MAEIQLAAEPRTEFGKGAARRIRRDKKVPVVLYGHGVDPLHVTLPAHEFQKALRQANVLLEIAVGTDSHLAIPKQVQRDPLKGFIEHADLLLVKKGEKVTVDVPVNLVGEALSGTLVVQDATTLSVEAEATHIPTGFEVSIEGLEAGTQILAKDVVLPKGATLVADEDTLVVNITEAPSTEALEAELAEAEAEAGIEHDAPAEDAEGDAAEAPAEDAAAE